MKILFLLLLFCSLAASVNAGSPVHVVILLPGTSLTDWQNADAPNLHRLMQSGALAVMNTRSAHHAGDSRPETAESVLLTLGAGARAAGTDSAAGFCPVVSEAPGMTVAAETLFERRTGIKPLPGRSVCLDWPAVAAANRSPDYDLSLGGLTDTLAQHGVKVEAGGGSAADWIAVGGDGTLQRTDTLHAAPGCCLVWDAGPNIEAADAAIGRAAAQTARLQVRLIVMSPYPSEQSYRRNARLTPVLLWGRSVPAGLLSSPSTRRPGLVTDTDFAPSIAGSFGIPRTAFRSLPFGFAWTAAARNDGIQQVSRLNRQAVQQANTMRLLPYLAVALALWLGAVTGLQRTGRRAGLLPLVPLAVWIAALFAVSPAVFTGVLAGLLCLAYVLVQWTGGSRCLTMLTCIPALALSLDMITGNPLMQRGMLGYSAIEGARYYGIGNEAMGLLLAASLVTVSRLWGSFPKAYPAFLSLMVMIVVLLGSAGAKAGGVLVSLAIFGTFLYSVSGRRWRLRTFAALAAVSAFVLFGAALADAYLLPGHSHIGEAVQRIGRGGIGEAEDIILRKLAVEGHLAYHSVWAVLLWTGILCTAYLWKQTPDLSHPDRALRLAGTVGVVSCLLLNDAGVVATAIFVSVLWSDLMTQKNLPAPVVSDAGRPGD